MDRQETGIRNDDLIVSRFSHLLKCINKIDIDEYEQMVVRMITKDIYEEVTPRLEAIKKMNGIEASIHEVNINFIEPFINFTLIYEENGETYKQKFDSALFSISIESMTEYIRVKSARRLKKSYINI